MRYMYPTRKTQVPDIFKTINKVKVLESLYQKEIRLFFSVPYVILYFHTICVYVNYVNYQKTSINEKL